MRNEEINILSKNDNKTKEVSLEAGILPSLFVRLKKMEEKAVRVDEVLPCQVHLHGLS